ncbi:MAG: hypothetical protein LBR35_01140, partial [Rickettsiales bacterium]|nr:hypothetical protein [Rickettsiales bacterium]
LLKKAEEVENEVIGGMNFEEIARNQGVLYGKLPFITASFLMENGKDYSGKPITKEMLAAAFEVGEGQETSLMPAEKGYVIIMVNKVKASGFLPLEKVRDKIEKIAFESEKNKLAYVKANEILASVRDGKSMTFNSLTLKRDDKNFDEQLLSKVFVAKVGEWFIARNNDAYYVATVDSVSTPARNQTDYNKVADLLRQQLPDLIMQDYMRYLENDLGVKIYPDRIMKIID